jgi:hypothetical protein
MYSVFIVTVNELHCIEFIMLLSIICLNKESSFSSESYVCLRWLVTHNDHIVNMSVYYRFIKIS